MSEIRHTPTPWHTTKRQPNVIVNEGGDKWIARATIGYSASPRFIGDADIAEANAAFIVEAVNSFEAHKALIAEREAVISKLRSALSDILGYDRNFYDNGRPGYEAIAREALNASEREA